MISILVSAIIICFMLAFVGSQFLSNKTQAAMDAWQQQNGVLVLGVQIIPFPPGFKCFPWSRLQRFLLVDFEDVSTKVRSRVVLKAGHLVFGNKVAIVQVCENYRPGF